MLWGPGDGELCLTFSDRQTTLFGTLLYDTFCVVNCVMFGGEGGGGGGGGGGS